MGNSRDGYSRESVHWRGGLCVAIAYDEETLAELAILMAAWELQNSEALRTVMRYVAEALSSGINTIRSGQRVWERSRP